MTLRSANVNVRVEPEIKAQAEAILERLGVSASAFINMTYRQIILQNGIPYNVVLPSAIKTREDISKSEFDGMLAEGLNQAKSGDAVPYEKAFDSLVKEL